MPRLKTFAFSDGLYDHLIATSSRPKALAAWGAHQDLFKSGLAREVDEPAQVKAATAKPDTPLRRKSGGKGGWSPE
ncbi:MAG: hypothetical protein JSR45_01840 [Proteobacteria bacterium]|nr:hypothetical protein [Pseudomonadota bacterium]